jgi:hypothetical protein
MKRDTSLLGKDYELEHLHTFQNVPVSMGCTDQDISKDILLDQIWDICTKSGIIQLRNTPPLDLVYGFPHNDAIGQIWENHHQKFCEFIFSHKNKSILEIGGGAGRLAKLAIEKNNHLNWTLLEPNFNYEKIDSENITVENTWFDSNYKINKNIDAIIHSHVFEHVYDPINFLLSIRDKMAEDTLHIFSIPNLFKFLENKYTNSICFEHTAFLSEDIVDVLLANCGFEVVNKEYYLEHSIFYSCKKSNIKNIKYPSFIYEKNKNLFLDFLSYHKNIIEEINNKLVSFDGKVYMFVAHIFSQNMIFNGLNIDRIESVLDNSKMKQGKRLYGTNFIVESPNILKEKSNSAIIINAGSYTEEIKKDIIQNINSKIIFF